MPNEFIRDFGDDLRNGGIIIGGDQSTYMGTELIDFLKPS